MIQLNKDLFVRLAISAKALKTDIDWQDIKKEKTVALSDLEKIDYDTDVVSTKPLIKPTRVEKIEDKIQNTLNNPELQALKDEIANAEEIFNFIKAKEHNPQVIARMEQRLASLKALVEQKDYL